MNIDKKLRTVAVLGAVAAVSVPGAASALSGSAAAGKTVKLEGIAFTPTTTKIKVGQTVTFRWLDGEIPHNVISKGSKRFKSIPTRKTGSRTVKFTQKGTYAYVCTIHATMKGKIVVG